MPKCSIRPPLGRSPTSRACPPIGAQVTRPIFCGQTNSSAVESIIISVLICATSNSCTCADASAAHFQHAKLVLVHERHLRAPHSAGQPPSLFVDATFSPVPSHHLLLNRLGATTATLFSAALCRLVTDPLASLTPLFPLSSLPSPFSANPDFPSSLHRLNFALEP